MTRKRSTRMLAWPRYNTNTARVLYTNDGTFQVIGKPVSGAISLTPWGEREWIATCQRCAKQSPMRQQVRVGGAIETWAHQHRCEERK